MTETNLRQANTKVNVVGTISEKNLEVVVEDGKKKIKGNVTVKVDDVNFVRFNVNVAEKTKVGTENKIYSGINTVMEQYKSISNDGEDMADKVRVSGELNLYHSTNNGKDVVSYKGNFFNRINDFDKNNDEPKAEFTIEMFVNSIIPEVDKEGAETRRLLVKGIVPTYNSVEPVTLIAGSDIAPSIESIIEIGQTVEFDGNIINNRVEKVKEIPRAIGKSKIEKTTSYINELIITGASAPYEEGVTPNKPYSKEAIGAALEERKNRLNSENNEKEKPSGAAKGRTMGF